MKYLFSLVAALVLVGVSSACNYGAARFAGPVVYSNPAPVFAGGGCGYNAGAAFATGGGCGVGASFGASYGASYGASFAPAPVFAPAPLYGAARSSYSFSYSAGAYNRGAFFAPGRGFGVHRGNNNFFRSRTVIRSRGVGY